VCRHGSLGHGSVHNAATDDGGERGSTVIHRQCPLMVKPSAGAAPKVTHFLWQSTMTGEVQRRRAGPWVAGGL
jgi:hypothetical protein